MAGGEGDNSRPIEEGVEGLKAARDRDIPHETDDLLDVLRGDMQNVRRLVEREEAHMSIPDEIKLNDIGNAMVASAPDGWHLLTLNVTAAGDMARGQLFVDMSDGSPHTRVRMDPDGVIAVSELREDMYQESVGTWYNATFQVAAGGQDHRGVRLRIRAVRRNRRGR